MASGHEQRRINRPNTWQLRPAVRDRSKKTLANMEPMVWTPPPLGSEPSNVNRE
jgi:hypothetical protein